MMNDTVREELQTKITSGNLPRIEPAMRREAVPNPTPVRRAAPESVPSAAKRKITADLTGPKTSPTLVEFQNKNTTLPDWRLQLQNAVQQRKGGQVSTPGSENSFPMDGGAALKAEIVQPATVQVAPLEIADPRVANAMRRIDRSRKVFSAETAVKRPSPPQVPPRSFPFDVIQNNARAAANDPTSRRPAAAANSPLKPKLVAQPAPAAELKRDTNKLPPLPSAAAKIERVEALPVTVFEPPKVEDEPKPASGKLTTPPLVEVKRIEIKADVPEIDPPYVEDDEEIDDLAPFSMRFGAGLFDLIIGAFGSMVVLAPFAVRAQSTFSVSNVLTVLLVFAVVMFLYMTVSLGFAGKTLGMRLFSLELVDAVENEYPTLQQAAVSSSMFLLSLAFLGGGFITIFFNEEKRAVHDLVSGTILVRDF